MERDRPATSGALANTQTGVSSRVAATLDMDASAFEQVLARCKAKGPPMTLPAAIGGLRIDLVTDNAHLASFWGENWHPAPATGRPHGIVRAFLMPGAPPHAYYCPSRDDALLANTDYYGQCKSWALGLAAAILQRRFGIHSIHGACLELAGKGIVVVGGTGSGKSTQVATLCKSHGGRLMGDDWTFIEAPPGGPMVVSQPERMLYIRTDNAADDPALAQRLRGAALENVMTKPGSCTSPACRAGNCMLVRGEAYCLWGHPNARALVPREWLAGTNGLASTAELGGLVVLYRDAKDPRTVTRDPGAVLDFLRRGPSEVRPGAGPPETWGTMSSVPYYNPYLLVPDTAAQDGAFGREAARGALLINTAHLGVAATAQAIVDGMA